MPLLLLVIVAGATALIAAAITSRWGRGGRRSAPLAMEAAREAGEAIRRHHGPGAGRAARLDPHAATGLALTLALLVIVVGGVLFGVLAYLVRGESADLVRWDTSVAEWGQRHAAAFSTDALELVTHLGEPTVVVVMAIALAAVETVRTRSRWVVPFLFLIVAGNGLLTTTVKNLADRVRPTLNPIAETLGPSFPSGHSSWSAVFFAAAALLLCRGRDRRARAVITGAAAALVVIVGGSRVLLGVHWLSDVIAGVALGFGWFCVCAIAFGGRLLQFGLPADEAARAATAGDGAPASRPLAAASEQPSRVER